MNFERVKREEADTVLKLYRSLLGTPYCVWTEEYPSEKEDVRLDSPASSVLPSHPQEASWQFPGSGIPGILPPGKPPLTAPWFLTSM